MKQQQHVMCEAAFVGHNETQVVMALSSVRAEFFPVH